MSILDDLLTFFLENNYGPASIERVVQIDEDLTPPCRAFYVEDDEVRISYETSNGDVITDKRVWPGTYHPIRVRKFTNITGASGASLRIFVVE